MFESLVCIDSHVMFLKSPVVFVNTLFGLYVSLSACIFILMLTRFSFMTCVLVFDSVFHMIASESTHRLSSFSLHLLKV